MILFQEMGSLDKIHLKSTGSNFKKGFQRKKAIKIVFILEIDPFWSSHITETIRITTNLLEATHKFFTGKNEKKNWTLNNNVIILCIVPILLCLTLFSLFW